MVDGNQYDCGALTGILNNYSFKGLAMIRYATMIILSAAVITPASAMQASHTATFLEDAVKGDNAEIAMGEMAIAQGSSAKVKALGQMLKMDHTAHKQKLLALAHGTSISDTAALSPEAITSRDMLKPLSGPAFDRAFSTHMVDDHEKDIAKYTAEISSKDNVNVRNMAKATLPTLMKHLAAARASL